MRAPLETVKLAFLALPWQLSMNVYIQVLLSVAAMVMTHPRLRAEFWSSVSIVILLSVFSIMASLVGTLGRYW